MKKKQILQAGMLLALAAVVTSCNWNVEKLLVDSGPQVSQTRVLKGFEEIDISGSPTVYFAQADTFSVKVVGPEGYVEDILTEVKGKTLTVRNRGKIGIINIHMDYDGAAVYVTSPDLTAVRLNGSGDFISRQRLDTDKMQITLRGSGDMDFSDIICDRCITDLTGSGDIDIDRLEAQRSDITLIGSGDIEVKQWRVDNTDISLRGSGDIKVEFMEGCRSAECKLIGSGDITLSGRLGHYSGEKRGSGDIDIDKLSVEK